VTVTDADGNVLGTGIASAIGGKFIVSLDPPAAHGEVLTVVLSDLAGNDSEPATLTVDAEAPAAATDVASNGKVVTGNAEPGAQVLVYTPEGQLAGAGHVNPDGTFEVTLDSNV